MGMTFDEAFEVLKRTGDVERQYSRSTTKLLTILGIGKEHAVKREDLATLMETDDTSMRRAVCLARLEGVCINNDQDGIGYYLPNTIEELKRQYQQTERRAKILFAQLRAIRIQMATIEDAEAWKEMEEELNGVKNHYHRPTDHKEEQPAAGVCEGKDSSPAVSGL